MKIIPYIFFSLILFIYVIFMSIVYIKFEKIAIKRREKKVAKIQDKIREDIKKQILKVIKNNNLSKDEILYVEKILKKSKSRQAFNKIISELSNNLELKDGISNFMANYLKIIENEIEKYSKKDSIRKCYFISNLGEYKIDSFKIQNFLMECLNDKSIYVRYNALNAIANIGKRDNFIEALIYMSKNRIYINDKVFIEIIDKFKNSYEMNRDLARVLNELNTKMQCLIINSFSKNKIDFFNKTLLMKLKDESNREVRISIIKYFEKNYYIEAHDKLIELLSSKWWEERAMAAKSLSKYYSFEVENSLKKSLKDKNWYVRLNSASSILDNNCNEKIIREVLDSEDIYAKEILLYVLQKKNNILYNKILNNKEEQIILSC
ncbi:MAG: PBS lyase [Clostridium perfringens]|uniref:PBS lyase n=1 Tax=Clostridium perfringens TaxID=1502 RepID=UPI00290A8F5A|nr:PBS lyase [Clostridium perfringens]MDM0491525.1 PBS lyase [Clostridium perfringens]MDU7955241.1 PBS lyase [Clostridium perfringens]MDU7962941.1 PBS lyase [Clostridium perfringens]